MPKIIITNITEDETAPELELDNGRVVYALWGTPSYNREDVVFSDGTEARTVYPVYFVDTDEPAESSITQAEYMMLEEAVEKMMEEG